MPEAVPQLSIGLAVRNGRGWMERCIGSILQQDFEDFELVISDNASDDGTTDVLAAYARADQRIRLNLNQANIGLHENMNRVLHLSRGKYFRWISADDWLEPGCLKACVEALEARPDAIGLTTSFKIHAVDGAARYENFSGEFPISADASRRLERMLWFFHAGDAKYDPIYGVYRRSSLMETQKLRRSEQTDWLLCAELALKGPILHLPLCLTNRTQKSLLGYDRAAFRRRLDPIRSEELTASPTRTCRDILELAMSANLSKAQLSRCKAALRRFWMKETRKVWRSKAANARHHLLRRLKSKGRRGQELSASSTL